MKAITTTVLATLLAVGSAACSERAQEANADAADAMADDVEQAGSDATAATDQAIDDAEAAANKVGDKVSKAADDAADATGEAIEDAGQSIQD